MLYPIIVYCVHEIFTHNGKMYFAVQNTVTVLLILITNELIYMEQLLTVVQQRYKYKDRYIYQKIQIKKIRIKHKNYKYKH